MVEIVVLVSGPPVASHMSRSSLTYEKSACRIFDRLIDQYVNPWKTTDLGKWLCNTADKPFTRPDDADPSNATVD